MSTKPDLHPVGQISAENDTGNKEYKLKLLNPSSNKLEQLTTQLHFRLDEGNGEAIYTLGVTDDGGLVGLTEDEFTSTKDVFNQICSKNNLTMTLLSEQKMSNSKVVYEYLIRENTPHKYIDIKVACAGNVDSGKSTLLGVLLSGQNDDGRGQARLNVFNYQHEVKTGRTSSIAQHILGFDVRGQPVNYGELLGKKKTWPEIIRHSNKIITFFDLCGHERYLKTTILGLTSQFPDLVMILVGSNMGLSQMTKEHIFLCLSLHIPFIVIITKIDIGQTRPEVMNATIQEMKQLLKAPGIRRIPCDIKTDDDIFTAARTIHSFSTVPFFHVSNVTGQGVDHLKKFLNIFPRKTALNEKKIFDSDNKVELHVEQVFNVIGVGTVIGGQLVQGKIKVGDKLIIGPNQNSYTPITVRSIHCKRVNVDEIEAGSYVCLGIKKPENLSIRRGNVVLSIIDKPVQVRKFTAEVLVLRSHSTTIKAGYQPVVHCCSVRQTCRIDLISKAGSTDVDDVLRTGDKGIITFSFCYKPEYLHKGSRLLLAEGRVKIIGKIVGVEEERVTLN